MINKWIVDEQTGWITRDDNITPGKDNKRMNKLIEHKQIVLSQIKADLEHWQNKPESFWLFWKGHPKNEIIAAKEYAIEKLESEIAKLSNH